MGFAFENLNVYQKSLDFSVSVIDLVDELDTPRKHFRLIEQLESACSSITLNIAEGKGRFSKKEFKRFCYIARGSLYETVSILQIFKRKKWITEKSYKKLYNEANEIHKMISGLIKSIKV
ncbi:MAG: 23S rRNA-intervening sequence protein [Candidatus Argoarchaeum ethanivorans]|uniref:23S rRNA-intervening sequence protein n=1 Tax=Candidatus Argoarchaeum ethanivorans TaxID=2608793 RepID=A0A812A118_9EURY|nr:MAG: 23S rRNA-intervening sequence protein [Candidatus Argoarchaeum ethanivorans]